MSVSPSKIANKDAHGKPARSLHLKQTLAVPAPPTKDRRSSNSRGRSRGRVSALPVKEAFGEEWAEVKRNYKVNEVLGKGSSGIVASGVCLETNRAVAIKQIKYFDETSYLAKKAFRELAILKRLSHRQGSKYITRLLDSYFVENKGERCLFLVMEHMPTDLGSFLTSAKAKDLEEKQVVQILFNLLQALHFLASANIIHRDIKPANILVNPDDLSIKICDFGLARTNPDPTNHTATPFSKKMRREVAKDLIHDVKERTRRPRNLSNHVATRHYRAPEIILQEKNYDQAMDMWGLGCIVPELMFQSKAYRQRKNTQIALFPGTSCFPLSPCVSRKSARVKDDEFDQLKVILQTLGDQEVEDYSFLTDQRAIEYLDNLQSGLDKIKFKEELPHSDPRLVGIVQNLLNFNPHFRYKASELLLSSLFDEARDGAEEVETASPIALEVDKAGAFDYKSCTDKKYSLEQYLKFIKEEVQKS